jgi:putative transposase
MMNRGLSGYMLFIIEVLAVKNLNNIVEQSHREVKGKSINVLVGNHGKGLNKHRWH